MSTLLSFSCGKALALFYSQASTLAQMAGCGWCKPAATLQSTASGPTALTFPWEEEPIHHGVIQLPVGEDEDLYAHTEMAEETACCSCMSQESCTGTGISVAQQWDPERDSPLHGQ